MQLLFYNNKSERPVDALAIKKYESLTHSLTDNFKSRDASASKKQFEGSQEKSARENY